MKYRPMLSSGPMVRALLDGSKTQTRRVCKPAQFYSLSTVVEVPDPMERGQVYNGSHFGDEEGDVQFACPYGQPGDRLWVRESFCPIYPQDPNYNGGQPIEYDYAATYVHGYRLGDSLGLKKKWKPSIHMPRAASRITLEITGVRVERLQDISEADAAAEGIERPEDMSTEAIEAMDVWPTGSERECFNALNQPVHQYRRLWGQINGPESWDANPWVWVVEFRRLEGGAA